MAIWNTLLLFPLFTVSLAFTHPGLLVTSADAKRIRAKLDAKKEPWTSSWEALTSSSYASADYTPTAASDSERATNGQLLWRDTGAAFNLALRWVIEGDDKYADAASNILVTWANTLKTFSGGDDAYLTAGLQGYQMANAAELLRDYEPFAADGLGTVSAFLSNTILPMNMDFLQHTLPSEHNVKHFFANWEQCNIAAAMAIGVLSDNRTAWDFAIDAFKNGEGNGNINNGISNIVEEPGTGAPLGQGQESGRDQGHSSLDFQLLGTIAQQAWNQGEDLYSYNDSRILLGYVYMRTRPTCKTSLLLSADTGHV